MLELALMIVAARRANLLGLFARPRWSADVKQFFKAFLPAVIGSAGVQIALFADYAEISAFEKDPAILRDLAFVPALSGLACPHWDRSASGLWIGLGLDTTRADLLQSVIEGVALRAAEVIAERKKTFNIR